MATAGLDNPSVLGIFTEQVLLGEIARCGISALGRGWEEKISFDQALSDSIPSLPREAKKCAVMYVLKKPTSGRDWPVRLREATWGDPEAAVHRHSLDRLNAINDSFKKKTPQLRRN